MTSKNSIKVTGVNNHLESLYKRMWAQFVESKEESYWIVDGKKTSIKEMDKRYPIVDLIKCGSEKGKGLDRRTNFY